VFKFECQGCQEVVFGEHAAGAEAFVDVGDLVLERRVFLEDIHMDQVAGNASEDAVDVMAGLVSDSDGGEGAASGFVNGFGPEVVTADAGAAVGLVGDVEGVVVV